MKNERREKKRTSYIAAIVIASCLLVFLFVFGMGSQNPWFNVFMRLISNTSATTSNEEEPEEPLKHPMLDPTNEGSLDPSFRAKGESKVSFSHIAGAYSEPFELELSGPAGWNVFYTVDGSLPTLESIPYYMPIRIHDRTKEPSYLLSAEVIQQIHLSEISDPFIPENGDVLKGSVIRAVAISPDGTKMTPIETRTFFVGANLPERYNNAAVISLATDPGNLLAYDKGIYVPGKTYDDWRNSPEGIQAANDGTLASGPGNYTNHGKEWERPVSIEMFDGENRISFVQDAGIRIQGGATRSNDQKSFNVLFRKEYGAKSVEYPLFADATAPDGSTIGKYKSFTLRTGGNDAYCLKFRDAYLQDLLKDMNFATQLSRPAVLFINGEYWGCYNLMEKYSSNMIARHYGLDEDNIVIVKNNELDEGRKEDMSLFDKLMSYASEDLSNPTKWAEFSEIADVQSMADYFAAQVYIANADCIPERNCALWRTRSKEEGVSEGDARWRWMLYDTELSSGIHPVGDERMLSSYDTLHDMALNHPLFLSALANRGFQEMFLSSLEAIGEKHMDYSHAIAVLESHVLSFKPLMSEFYARFGDTEWTYQSSLDELSVFLRSRAGYIIPKAREELVDYAAFSQRIEQEKAELAAAGELGVPEEEAVTPVLENEFHYNDNDNNM